MAEPRYWLRFSIELTFHRNIQIEYYEIGTAKGEGKQRAHIGLQPVEIIFTFLGRGKKKENSFQICSTIVPEEVKGEGRMDERGEESGSPSARRLIHVTGSHLDFSWPD
ncbi:hypothetical protein KM043_006549 [Ampulex compressa]|nr:hypothetical protein KM043_006549 [Ampulex compressa]